MLEGRLFPLRKKTMLLVGNSEWQNKQKNFRKLNAYKIEKLIEIELTFEQLEKYPYVDSSLICSLYNWLLKWL
jgi:hypothetical protein